MNIEQKAKAYDKALDDIRAIYPNLKGDAKLAVEHAFPELAESEDEKISTRLLEYFHGFKDSVECPVFWEGLNIDNILTWLEKQKDHFRDDTKMVEQKPAEWSDEDEEMYARIVRRYTDYEGVIMRTKEESVADKMLNAMAQEEIWLKSLRPQPHWKPSEEQMEVDLEKASRNVYESWMGGTMNDVRRDMVELGKVLNARKEDSK